VLLAGSTPNPNPNPNPNANPNPNPNTQTQTPTRCTPCSSNCSTMSTDILILVADTPISRPQILLSSWRMMRMRASVIKMRNGLAYYGVAVP
jgi:hypothetical protein